MKKIKEIAATNKLLDVYNKSIILSDKKSIQQIDDNLNLIPLVEGNIYSSKILGNSLFYQLDRNTNIHIYSEDIVLKEDYGYILHSSLKCASYIYIYGGKDKTSIFLDSNLQFVKKAPEYCNFSYQDYLFEDYKNTLSCYILSDKRWNYIHSDDSKIHIISGYKDKVLIYSESGDLFALNIETGEVCWKYPEQCPYGRYGYFDEYVYHMYKNEFREISADTGKLIRIMDIQELREKESFFASAGIKVYDDYIFARNVDGAVVIIDRKKMVIKEIIHFENHLINANDALQWLNNRLYVQDAEHVIHVFEE